MRRAIRINAGINERNLDRTCEKVGVGSSAKDCFLVLGVDGICDFSSPQPLKALDLDKLTAAGITCMLFHT